MDRRRMESFGSWSAPTYISPDEDWPETTGQRTFALGKNHHRHRRDHESGKAGEPNMRLPFWRRERRNEELDEEVQAHLTLAEREAMESGQPRKEARLTARQEFGNVGLAEEITRDMWGWRWLSEFLQDTRYGLRLVGADPHITHRPVISTARVVRSDIYL